MKNQLLILLLTATGSYLNGAHPRDITTNQENESDNEYDDDYIPAIEEISQLPTVSVPLLYPTPHTHGYNCLEIMWQRNQKPEDIQSKFEKYMTEFTKSAPKQQAKDQQALLEYERHLEKAKIKRDKEWEKIQQAQQKEDRLSSRHDILTLKSEATLNLLREQELQKEIVEKILQFRIQELQINLDTSGDLLQSAERGGAIKYYDAFLNSFPDFLKKLTDDQYNPYQDLDDVSLKIELETILKEDLEMRLANPQQPLDHPTLLKMMKIVIGAINCYHLTALIYINESGRNAVRQKNEAIPHVLSRLEGFEKRTFLIRSKEENDKKYRDALLIDDAGFEKITSGRQPIAQFISSCFNDALNVQVTYTENPSKKVFYGLEH